MIEKLIHGNFLEKINEIDDESIDLILTDIPYNISKKNGLGGYDKKIIEIEQELILGIGIIILM